MDVSTILENTEWGFCQTKQLNIASSVIKQLKNQYLENDFIWLKKETSNLSELHKPLQLQRKFLAGITQKKYFKCIYWKDSPKKTILIWQNNQFHSSTFSQGSNSCFNYRMDNVVLKLFILAQFHLCCDVACLHSAKSSQSAWKVLDMLPSPTPRSNQVGY